jgi:hypothetical protein
MTVYQILEMSSEPLKDYKGLLESPLPLKLTGVLKCFMYTSET